MPVMKKIVKKTKKPRESILKLAVKILMKVNKNVPKQSLFILASFLLTLKVFFAKDNYLHCTKNVFNYGFFQ